MCFDIPIDGGGEEDEIGPEHLLDEGERDGGRFVDHNQLRLRETMKILGNDDDDDDIEEEKRPEEERILRKTKVERISHQERTCGEIY